MTMKLCEHCGSKNAHEYQQWRMNYALAAIDDVRQWLCVACARTERRRLRVLPAALASPIDLTRQQLIARLDALFAASGVFEICAQCHAQGTGCCPPTCRILGAHGCHPESKAGKTLFCATFLCSALLNAIAECDAELGRLLKWLKTEVGVTEWRVYEMYARVPAAVREPLRPLTLPAYYPALPPIDHAALRAKLLPLLPEILQLRRTWQVQEQAERSARTAGNLT